MKYKTLISIYHSLDKKGTILKPFLNPKSTGLFTLGIALGAPHCKIRSRQAKELRLSVLIAYIMFYKIQFWKLSNNEWRHYQKQWPNWDLCENKQIIYIIYQQIIYHSKGIDKSYTKMCFLLNFSYCVKIMDNFVKFWLFLRCPFTKYGHVSSPKM